MRVMETNYVKENITTYLPGLISLIGNESNFGWTKINTLHESLLAARKEKANGETIFVSTTIFDVVVAAKMKTAQLFCCSFSLIIYLVT